MKTAVVWLVGVSLVVGCKDAPPTAGEAAPKVAPTAAPTAAPKANSALMPKDEAAPPLHTKSPAAEHQAPTDAPPPTAKRTGQPEKITTDYAEVTVSDITVAVGKTGAAVIEIRPLGLWKFNTDFPSRVAIGGVVSAVPPRLVYKSTDAAPNPMQITNGGLRLDIAFSGDAPGEDLVAARLRYGVCTMESCVLRKQDVSFRVTVVP